MLPLLHDKTGPIINSVHMWEYFHIRLRLQFSLMGATISKQANGYLRSILSLLFLLFVGVDKWTNEWACFFIRSGSNNNERGQRRSLGYFLLPLVSPSVQLTFSSFIWMYTLGWMVLFFKFDGISPEEITASRQLWMGSIPKRSPCWG